MKTFLEILWWILGLFGVGKPDPVRDARKETEARVKAEAAAEANRKALEASEAARKGEAAAATAALEYQQANQTAAIPLPKPQTQEEWQKDLDAINKRHREREVP